LLEINKIHNMDCIDGMKLIEDESIDLVVTDPPYGIEYQNNYTLRKHNKIYGDNKIDYLSMGKECYRVLKNNSHAYFFTRFDVYPYHYVQLKKIGFNIKNVLVIEKGHIGGGGDLDGGFANNCEWLIFCHKGRRVFNKTKLMKNTKPVGKKQQGIIIQHRNTKQDLIVVGLVIDTLKALIIHHGKKRIICFILPSKT